MTKWQDRRIGGTEWVYQAIYSSALTRVSPEIGGSWEESQSGFWWHHLMCPRVFHWHNPEFRLIFHLSVNIWDINHLNLDYSSGIVFFLPFWWGKHLLSRRESSRVNEDRNDKRLVGYTWKRIFVQTKEKAICWSWTWRKKDVTGWSLPAPSQRSNPRMCLNFNSECSNQELHFEFPSAWEKEPPEGPAIPSPYSWP